MTTRYHISPALSLLFAFLLTGSFAAAPLSALAQGSSPGVEEEDGPTALSVGNLSTDFEFGGTYNYNVNARSVMVSGPNGSLLVDYASGLGTGGFDRDGRRTIGAEALFGGNAYLFKNFLVLPLDIYIPIRLNLDYRYVQPKNPELSNLHRGAGGLGAGGGAQLQLPVGPSFIKDNLYIRGTGVIVPAVGTTLSSEDDEVDSSPVSASRTRMRRTIDLNLEVLFTELLGENTGVMAGYTFRTYSRSAEKPSSVGDVIDAATLTGDYVQANVQHMIRVGLSW